MTTISGASSSNQDQFNLNDHVIIEIPNTTQDQMNETCIYAPSQSPITTNSNLKTEEKTPVEDGMAIGFIAASCLTIIGIPVIAVSIAEAKGKISNQTAKDINGVLVPLTFPGLFVGILGGIVGAGIGGIIKACRNIMHNVKRPKSKRGGH